MELQMHLPELQSQYSYCEVRCQRNPRARVNSSLILQEQNLISQVDLGRDYAVTNKRYAIYSRRLHTLAYFEGFVYALGGINSSKAVKPCERLDLAHNVWGRIADLPVQVFGAVAVVKEDTRRLYLLSDARSPYSGIEVEADSVGLILELDLVSLKWLVLPLRLIAGSSEFTVFSCKSQHYFIVAGELYRWAEDFSRVCSVQLNARGLSYYCEGYLYSFDQHTLMVLKESMEPVLLGCE
jgi:hypothetical protein